MIRSLALPHDDDPPAKSSQRPLIAGVARDVLPELLRPEAHVTFGLIREAAVGVTVPETAVNEHGRAMPREHYVRPAGKFDWIESESKSKAMEN